MDLQIFTQWAGAVGLALGIINMFWNMAGRAAKPVNDKIAAAEQKTAAVDAKVVQYRADLIDHDRRIQALESEQRHAPTGEQVTSLRLTCERLDGHVKRLEESMNGLGHTVRRIDEYLRSEKA